MLSCIEWNMYTPLIPFIINEQVFFFFCSVAFHQKAFQSSNLTEPHNTNDWYFEACFLAFNADLIESIHIKPLHIKPLCFFSALECPFLLEWVHIYSGSHETLSPLTVFSQIGLMARHTVVHSWLKGLVLPWWHCFH